MASKVYHSTCENSNFVSGSRPLAPIKTAIIRPTNFYDSSKQPGGAVSPEAKMKLVDTETTTNYLSEVDATEKVTLCGEEASKDPLSDSSAVMYGTNATCRRKSKVEAWIESSSSAHSDESPALPSPGSQSLNMGLPPLSPGPNTHHNNTDLSFENLCQELIALSESCTNLERMINYTQAELYKSTPSTEKKASTQSTLQSTLTITIDTEKELANKHDTSPSPNPPPLPPRRSSSIYAMEKHCNANNDVVTHRTEVNLVPSQSWKPNEVNTAKERVKSIIVPPEKLTALTVDVGPRSQAKHAKVTMPVKNGLITVTSPRLYFVNGQNATKEHPVVVPSTSLSTALLDESSGSFTSVNCAQSAYRGTDGKGNAKNHLYNHIYQDNHWSCNSTSRGDNSWMINSLKSDNSRGERKSDRSHLVEMPGHKSMDSGDKVTDHVAAAIITRPGSAVSDDGQAYKKMSRSLSEPSTFVTPTPYKRLNLTRVPNKRDSKVKQTYVGMDFIRGNSMEKPLSTGSFTRPLANNMPSPAKDNLLMNNLDYQRGKKSTSNAQKLPLAGLSSAAINRLESIGSDSVFEKDVKLNKCPTPTCTSTVKNQLQQEQQQHQYQSATVKSNGSHGVSSNHSRAHLPTQKDRNSSSTTNINETLSSSFESEALDFLASLKSKNAMRQQYNRHGKFPVDVDPITGSPRQQLNGGSKNCLHTSTNSNRSTCPGSPTPISCNNIHQHSRSPQPTPAGRRSRQSYYDNVLQPSPYCGVRMSVESGSSSGTVFSRPWGDISKWEDYFHCNHENSRHAFDFSDIEFKQGSTNCSHVNLSSSQNFRNGFCINKHKDQSTSSLSSPPSQETPRQIPSCGLSKFQMPSLPDVALQANPAQLPSPASHVHTTWELTLDRATNRVRSYTKLLHTDHHSCEITRHTHQLLSDSRVLPGELVGRFLTCTWETNATDVGYLQDSRNNTTSTKSTRLSTGPKTDWYSSNIQSQWSRDIPSGKYSFPCATQAYANDGYLLNTYSRETCRSDVNPASSNHKEHRVLSNVRQFIDGMKRYLLNQPDTQMMFAIQRERVKLASDQFINLDAIMESVLEKVILLPLSDHLLSIITSHPDYSLRQINKMESGMKTIVLHRNELFAHLMPSISAIDSYEQTLRSAFKSMKTEFSPLSKLQFLLQTALLIILVHNKRTTHKQHDLALLFIYTLACYGDATLIVHLAYIRHLIPHSLRSGATAYVLSIFETCGQIFDRITTVPSTLNHRTMILCEILDRLSCQVVIADESTNQVLRRHFALSKWSTVSEMIEILNVDTGNHDVKNYQLYLMEEDKEVLLRPKDNLSELITLHARADEACALVFRRPNTQMLLPHPK